MVWRMTADMDEFEDVAGGFLLADPVRNTVLLTVVASLRVSGPDAYGDAPPQFGWYRDSDDSEVQAAFLRTPPKPAIMTDAPADAVRALVDVLGDGVPGLSGPADCMRAFAQEWRAAGGQATVVSHRRLFRLPELIAPRPMARGRARSVTEADRDLLVAWFDAFGIDVGEPKGDAERAVDRRLANGELVLWEDDGGVPCSLAGATTPVAGVMRVAPVYTPATLRGRGYAGAVTAAISRRGLEAGHEVILFTNLANATSNALYQRLGYRAIGQWSELELAPVR